MKTYFLFAVLWILLVWLPAENMRYAFCHYDDNSRLESVLRDEITNSSSSLEKEVRMSILQGLIEERRAHLRHIEQDGVAMLATSGLWLWFIWWHRNNPHYLYWRFVHPGYWRLVHCWNVIRLRRGIVTIVLALTVALVALVTFSICPIYSSTAYLFICNSR